MEESGKVILAVVTAIIGVAILAVIFSPRANTGPVIGAAGQAFGGILATAVSPVTGASASGYSAISTPGGSNFGGFSGGGGGFDPTSLFGGGGGFNASSLTSAAELAAMFA